MKKNVKLILPMLILATATTVFANAANFANQNLDTTVFQGEDVVMSPAGVDVGVTIDNQAIDNSSTIIESEHVLFPVRTVFEAMGFEVGYDNESRMITLVNGAQYVTFVPNEDAYSFARMAHQPLGSAPVLKNGVTYVPVELLELMGVDYMVNRNVINIFTDDMIAHEDSEFDEFGVNSLVNFEERPEEGIPADLYDDISQSNEVLYENIVKITNIDLDRLVVTVENNEGNLVELVLEENEENLQLIEVLSVDGLLNVTYGDIMTSSEPPQNTPKNLEVIYTNGINELQSSIVVIEAIEIDEELDEVRVTVNSEERGLVVLNMGSTSELSLELEVGQNLAVEYGDMMTMSLPPMNTPKSFMIVGSTENFELSEVLVKSIDADGMILVEDSELGEVLLNPLLNPTNELDVEVVVGDTLFVKYGNMMTRSIPPMNTPEMIIKDNN